MSELGEKVKAALERLRAFQPRNGEGYYLAFSGGKDSVVCKHLLGMAGIKFDAHYRVPFVAGVIKILDGVVFYVDELHKVIHGASVWPE